MVYDVKDNVTEKAVSVLVVEALVGTAETDARCITQACVNWNFCV